MTIATPIPKKKKVVAKDQKLAKPQKQKKLEIATILRYLVKKAFEGNMEFEEFKSLSEKLHDLFKETQGAAFLGFTLSESFQLLWLSPDFYLVRGSFVQQWLARKFDVRPEDIVEETVADYIYMFLKDRYNDFSGVRLVEPANLPDLQELGIDSADSVQIPQGVLTHLVLSPDSTYDEVLYIDEVKRRRTSEAPLRVISGDTDAVYANPGSGLTSQAFRRLITRCCSDIAAVGTIGETELVNPVARSLAIADDSVHRDRRNLLIAEYSYRDSNGEIHEQRNEYTPQTIEEVRAQITQFEQESARQRESQTASSTD